MRQAEKHVRVNFKMGWFSSFSLAKNDTVECQMCNTRVEKSEITYDKDDNSLCKDCTPSKD